MSPTNEPKFIRRIRVQQHMVNLCTCDVILAFSRARDYRIIKYAVTHINYRALYK